MWAPLITALLGLWLLAWPDVLGYGDPARTNHVAGAFMATFGTIAMSESTRPVRWVNLALGLWLIIAPILLNYPMGRGIASVLFWNGSDLARNGAGTDYRTVRRRMEGVMERC